MQSFREKARGKWVGILSALGFDERILDGKHRPCPNCGGVDRWRFDDKDGNGTFYCSHCGPGSGVELVMRVKDWDFKTAAAEIEKAAGFVKPESVKPAESHDKKVQALRRAWRESFCVKDGDPVSKYLWARGLTVPHSRVLRYHPDLAYRDGEKFIGKHHAMLALVQSPTGEGVTMHRTYITFDGQKANVSTVKKLMPGLPMAGAAVRLYAEAPVMGVAEGIETAIAASMMFKIPVWSAISASGVTSFIPPESCRELIVFADNDENMVGQKAAYQLAARMSGDISVKVEIPKRVGTDWADCL